jgi:hypothetical protein
MCRHVAGPLVEKRIKKGAVSEVSFERKMRRGEKPPEVWLKPHQGGFASTSFCSRRWRAECVFNYAFLNKVGIAEQYARHFPHGDALPIQ